MFALLRYAGGRDFPAGVARRSIFVSFFFFFPPKPHKTSSHHPSVPHSHRRVTPFRPTASCPCTSAHSWRRCPQAHLGTPAVTRFRPVETARRENCCTCLHSAGFPAAAVGSVLFSLTRSQGTNYRPAPCPHVMSGVLLPQTETLPGEDALCFVRRSPITGLYM